MIITKYLVASIYRYGNLYIRLEDEVPFDGKFIAIKATLVGFDNNCAKLGFGVTNKLYFIDNEESKCLLVASRCDRTSKILYGRKISLEGDDLGDGKFAFDDNTLIYELNIPKTTEISRLKYWRNILNNLMKGVVSHMMIDDTIKVGSLVVGKDYNNRIIIGHVLDIGKTSGVSYARLDTVDMPIMTSLLKSLDKYITKVDKDSIKRNDIIYAYNSLWTYVEVDCTHFNFVGWDYLVGIDRTIYTGYPIPTEYIRLNISLNDIRNLIIDGDIHHVKYKPYSIIKHEEDKNNMNRTIKTIETKEGFRYVRGSKKKEQIATITTTVTFTDGTTSSAMCDKSQFDARQGALEASVKVGCANFTKAYEKYIKEQERKKRAEYKASCRCASCGKTFDTPEDARACEQEHRDKRAEKKNEYKKRKEERYILEVAKSRLECEKRERKIEEAMNKLAFNECNEALIEDINTRLNTDKLVDGSIDGLTEE